MHSCGFPAIYYLVWHSNLLSFVHVTGLFYLKLNQKKKKKKKFTIVLLLAVLHIGPESSAHFHFQFNKKYKNSP
jgi:hypothetical protein